MSSTTNAQDLMASLMGGGGDSALTGNGGGDSDLFGPLDDPTPEPTAAASTSTTEPPTTTTTPSNDDPSLIVPSSTTSTTAQPVIADDPLAMGAATPSTTEPSFLPEGPSTTMNGNTSTTVIDTAPAPAPMPAPAPSLLMQSGLLGDTSAVAATTLSTLAGDANNNTQDDDGLFASVDQEEAEQEALKRKAAEEAEADRVRQEQEAAAAAEKARQEQAALQQQQQQQLQDQMQSVHLGSHSNNTISPNNYSQQQPPPPPQQQPSYGQASANYGQNSMMMQQSGMMQPNAIPAQPGYLSNISSANTNTNNMANSMVNGYSSSQPPPPQQQQQRQQQVQGANGSYPYNQQPGMPQQPQPQPPFPGSANSMAGSMMQQQQQQQPDTNRYYHPSQNANTMAGMHNPSKALGQAPVLTITKPEPVPTFYEKVVVSEPLLVAQPKGLLGSLTGQSAPHWSYQVTTYLKTANGNNNNDSQQQQQQYAPQYWVVRRRFRHVVAMEDRMHEEIPGAILPPRPEKHATRALEEATTHQSAEFATQRAAELQVYLNQLIQHPYAYNTHTLRLFLSLQDDMGTAWPEVSSNVFTRISNASVGAAVKVSEQTQATKFPWQDPMGQTDDYGEDNAELLALANQENARMAAVLQAVPKLEGAITLLREGAERMGSTGMELGRMAKEVQSTDTALAQPFDIVSSGMLRSGRRNKRLALELFAALHTYSQHYKSCRYEKQAFMDRRLAMMRRQKARPPMYPPQQQQHMYGQQQPSYGAGGFQPHMYQQQQNPYGAPMGQYGNQAGMLDNTATDAWQECDEIGKRLRSEINRLAYSRRTDWLNAVKVLASSYKEATTENVAIWQSVQESYLRAFPQYEEEVSSQQPLDMNQSQSLPPQQQPAPMPPQS